MKILHLTLKKIWFDKIAVGDKKNEYREIKPYWEKRLIDKHYVVVVFKNGYSKGCPEVCVEIKGIKIEDGRFVISLGNILYIKNYMSDTSCQ